MTSEPHQSKSLLDLPNELIFEIFSENIPNTRAEIGQYFTSHSLNQRTFDLAREAFSSAFTLQASLDFRCHYIPQRSKFYNRYISYPQVGCDAGEIPWRDRVHQVEITVRCEHSKFCTETIEETMLLLETIRRDLTTLKKIVVIVDSPSDDFEFNKCVAETVEGMMARDKTWNGLERHVTYYWPAEEQKDMDMDAGQGQGGDDEIEDQESGKDGSEGD